MNLGALGGLTAFAAPHLAEAQEEEESEADTSDHEAKA
jgi:hypothetical protein